MPGHGRGWGRVGDNGGGWSGGGAPAHAVEAAGASATVGRRAAAAASAAAAADDDTLEAQGRSEPARVRGGGCEEEQQGRAGTVMVPEVVPAHTEMGVRGTMSRGGEDYVAGALRKRRFREAEQGMQAYVAVEAEVPADGVEGTVGKEMEGHDRSVGGATAGLAVGIVMGPELVPDMAIRIPCDAHEENRKKRKSNDLRQLQFYEREIIQEINAIDNEHGGRRQRTEAGPSSSSGDIVGRQMMESGGRYSLVVGRKRCREEGEATREEAGEQGKGIEAVRARTGRARVKRVVRLAEVVDGVRGQPENVRDGVSRGRSVRWVGGRWHIEDEGGERWNSEESGGAGTDGVTVDSDENEERRRGVWVLEAAIAETTALRRGYTRPAAWDEGAMIQAMARMDNPTLSWRYGGGDVEEQGDTEAQPERGDG